MSDVSENVMVIELDYDEAERVCDGETVLVEDEFSETRAVVLLSE